MSSRAHRVRVLVATLISWLPVGALRRALLRLCLGYTIDATARVEMFAVLAVARASLGARSTVGRFTKFAGPFVLTIEDGARIGPDNVITCGHFAIDPKKGDQGFVRSCRLGRDSLVTASHFIDASGGFELGEHAWIAGRGSQFWTHGAGAGGSPITIGARTYVGSAVRFAPGAAVGDDTLVSLGSVVTQAFTASHVLLGGVPAKVLRENIDPVWPKDGEG